MKKVAILQSNYIPWKGYFDLIYQVDDFVFYDTVQSTTNDWRNRNQIKTSNGDQWLTIPVSIKSSRQLINETKTANNVWTKKHFKSIEQAYAKAEFFGDYKEELKECYNQAQQLSSLSEINLLFIKWINKKLGITTNIHFAEDFDLPVDRIERLVSICETLNADVYLSGPSAKDYLNEENFTVKGIAVEWMEYGNYSEYKQLHGDFIHFVSVLDLLFNQGANHFLNSNK